MLAGGDSIDDVDVLRSGAAQELFDDTRAPSTIGNPSSSTSFGARWSSSPHMMQTGCVTPSSSNTSRPGLTMSF